jgi:hypothetical protein
MPGPVRPRRFGPFWKRTRPGPGRGVTAGRLPASDITPNGRSRKEAERMVRAFVPKSRDPRSRSHPFPFFQALATFSSALLFLSGGCALAPRAQMDECQQQSRTLRSENARLKDQLLVLQGQNRDLADRALDDSHQLANQHEAIERLETSVQAYQDERARLESAYNQLASSLGESRGRTDDRQSQAASSALPKKQPPRAESTTAAARDAADRDRVR